MAIFYSCTIYSQGYDVFKADRRLQTKPACTGNPGPGLAFIQPASISVASGNDHLRVNFTPGVAGGVANYYYGIENMLCGVTLETDGNPTPLILSNQCYDDLLYSFSIRPVGLDINLTTPTGLNTGDHSTGSEVTLKATKDYHELVYNWQVYISPELSGLMKSTGENRCGYYFEGGEVSGGGSIGNPFGGGPVGGGPIGGGGLPVGEGSLGWVNLPDEFLGKDEITFTAKDLFGDNAYKAIGKSLQFRIGMSNGYNSRIIPFSFIVGSPEFEDIKPIDLSCNYINNGSFELLVDRDLIEDEQLIVTLYIKDATNPEGYSLYGQQNMFDLVDNGDRTFSFFWDNSGTEGLSADNYTVKYQVRVGTTGIPSSDPSWGTLKFSNDFDVLKPKAIEYEVTRYSEPTCLGARDGEIELKVSKGEDGRNYSYILYTVNGSTFTPYQGMGWIPFASEKTTTVIGLPKDNYRIQVKDNRNCFEQ